jgi:anhydro-N-acetylmuramic acid kinase
MDAVDAVLARISDDEPPIVVGWHNHDIPASLQRNFVTLSAAGNDTIDLLGQADNQAGELFADAAIALLEKFSRTAGQITAIGSHGQTIRHRPPSKECLHPFSLQIGDPNIIASRTGITTVADFRRADIAAGGQGAPLVPAFHRHLFADPTKNRVIVNIGGIANITWLPVTGEVTGFDTGPGNRLIDHWATTHLQKPFDDKGLWAAKHSANDDLLDIFMNHAFFLRPPPKSTGREEFNEQWLTSQLLKYDQAASPGVVQATLLKLTVSSIVEAIRSHCHYADEIYVCGGGAFNDELMKQLQDALVSTPVASTATLNVDPGQVEALAFAWLAQRTLLGLPGNLPSVTGAREEVVLGGIYPARPGSL